MPTLEDRAISDFPIALQLLNTALVLISNPDGQGGYDSYQATLTEIGRVVLETQYTQDLGNVDVFTAIKNCRVLSGTTTPTSSEGADGQLYVKYTTSGNDTSVTGLYVKLSGSWCEISTGGGGDVGIECTQAQYDAWEQAGTLLQDTNYYITDGQAGGGVVIDDTTASLTTVYSSSKVADLLDDKADSADVYTKSEVDTALSGKQSKEWTSLTIPTPTIDPNNPNKRIYTFDSLPSNAEYFIQIRIATYGVMDTRITLPGQYFLYSDDGFKWSGKVNVFASTNTIEVITNSNSYQPATYYLRLDAVFVR